MVISMNLGMNSSIGINEALFKEMENYILEMR
jgi:hypothetical protein